MIKFNFILLFIISLLNLNLFAQTTESVKINGSTYSIQVADEVQKFSEEKTTGITTRDYYEFTDPSKPGTPKLPFKNIFLAIPSNSRIEISNLKFNSSTEEKVIPTLNPTTLFKDSAIIYIEKNYKDIKLVENKEPIVKVERYFWFREFYIVEVKINNYRFQSDNSNIEVISNINFDVNILPQRNILPESPLQIQNNFDKALQLLISNAASAEQYRNRNTISLEDTTGNWIDYGANYLKMGLAEDAVCRITKTDLNVLGINTSTIDPRTFKIFESGKEIDICVTGEDDGIFDENDFIEFWGHKNYPKISYHLLNADNEEYNEYLNRYTDTTFYFLTWNGNFGNRADTININPTGISDSLFYYSKLLHFEINPFFDFNNYDEIANQTPDWKKNKTWYRHTLISSRTYNITLDEIYPNKSANISAKAVSWASNIPTNSHQVKLLFNSVIIDSNSIDRFKQLLLTGVQNSISLINGTNQLKLENLPNGSSPNGLLVDWFEIDYPRNLKLQDDSLYFRIPNDVSSGLKIIRINNANSPNFRIYKVRPEFKFISNYQFNSSALFLVDTVHPGDEYYILRSDKKFTPKFYYAKNFINLRSLTNQTDYISVTHPKFLSTVENYIQTISNLFSLTSSVYNVNDIFDEFSFGYPYPEAIRLFSNVLYNNAQNPKPQYLTLIGDANYDYKYFNGTVGGRNYVPAYGNPVSDNWYSVWDINAPPIPQLKVGRIPINESYELDYYLTKIENNESKPFDEWNKKYLLFSGGIDPGEYAILKSANDSIVNKYISPKPVAGNYTHFYKTISPPSDFGPYSSEEIQSAISSGGLFISYIGHSGTATWDNSINSTNQLYNSVDRNPLITDFGCSTNKYAEPNIICFGERFLFNSTGQALNYLGNSSLGFQSTAITASTYFYQEIFNDSLSEVGAAHTFSKVELISRTGNSSVNKIYALTNIILGDPAIRLKIPKLPNFNITSVDIKPTTQQISEDLDSVEFKVSIKNLGLANIGSLEVNYLQEFESDVIKNENILIPIPNYSDTISIWLNVKDKAGLHKLIVNLDPNNLIQEIYEDDNNIEFDFNVYSSSLRDLLTSVNENSSLQSLRLLNPANYNSNIFPIELQISDENSFSNSNSIIVTSDTFFTDINVSSVNQSKRYFIRYRINSDGNTFSGTKSFFNEDSIKYLLIDSLSFNGQDLTNVRWENDSLRIVPDTTSISVLSSGFNAGATCVISKNGINLLSNTFFAGMGIVVFDNITLEVDTSAWFQLFNQPANVEALATLIDSIPIGKIVAIGVADDARNNLSIHLKNSIKSLGSNLIDSLQFRGSWAIIGWKGAPTGSIIEMVKPPLPPESVFIDSNFVTLSDSGFFVTNPVGIAKSWKKIQVNENIPGDASITYQIEGLKKTGERDTIRTLEFINGTADLSDIDANVYPKLILTSNLRSTSDKKSPTIKKVAIDFEDVPELGLNYQVVQTLVDSVYQGDSISLDFSIYNVGGSNADSFRVQVDLIRPNNSSRSLIDSLIDRIHSNDHKNFTLKYTSNINDGDGDFRFKIVIDPTLNILEKYKDNNIYDKPFFVIKDTTITSINETSTTILADGIEIIDGDYVSSRPEININIKYPIWFPLNDTSNMSLYIDNIEIPVANTQISFDTVNRIITYKLITTFDNGDHSIKVIGKDRYGNLDINSAVERYFTTTNELKLLDVYNYPNPFSNSTDFVFNLTQIPEELNIRIFSIAGRLIKEIKLNSNELNVGFNKIYFNGRDEDGDLLANGVYLYKVITKKDAEIVTVVNKMAIIR